MKNPSATRRNQTLELSRARALARTPAQSFRHGMVQSFPLLLVIIPFALLFGVVAQGVGLDIAQIMGFSTLVLAGASQFTAVQLLTENAPVWLVIVSSLAVNLRMAMYSASLVPWLGGASPAARSLIAYCLIDQTYALSIDRFQEVPQLSLSQRLGYFFGTAIVMCVPWLVFTWVGAMFGRAIPAGVPLDFAVPITFLALIAPALRSPAHIAAAVVSVVGTLLLSGLPSGVGLMIAAVAAMLTGAWVETAVARRKEGWG